MFVNVDWWLSVGRVSLLRCREWGDEVVDAHLLRRFCALAFLFELRVNGLLFLLHELCLPKRM